MLSKRAIVILEDILKKRGGGGILKRSLHFSGHSRLSVLSISTTMMLEVATISKDKW